MDILLQSCRALQLDLELAAYYHSVANSLFAYIAVHSSARSDMCTVPGCWSVEMECSQWRVLHESQMVVCVTFG